MFPLVLFYDWDTLAGHWFGTQDWDLLGFCWGADFTNYVNLINEIDNSENIRQIKQIVIKISIEEWTSLFISKKSS